MANAGTMEREVKLEADLAFTLPDLRDLVGGTERLPEENLWTIYFDTADLRLWQRGITFRHRSGDQSDPGIWTIKLPKASRGATLDRRELTWSGSPDSLPDGAMKILQGLVRRSPLKQIAHIETLRRRLTLQGHRDLTLGELDDDTVTIHGGPNDGRRFRQIELEVEERDVELVEQVLDRLRAAGARPDRAGPKLGRALGHDSFEGQKVKLGPTSLMRDVVKASIAGALDRILDHEYLLRIDETEPPAHDVHQTRVASRRLRSDLKTFEDVFDPVWVRHIRRDLKWFGRSLGIVRDVDVLCVELEGREESRSADLQGSAQLASELQQQRRSASIDLAEVLASERYLRLLDKLYAAAERPPLTRNTSHGHIAAESRAGKALPLLVRRPWKRLRRQVKRAGNRPTDYQLHRIRIRSKQLRYACEAASAVIGRPARKMGKAAEHLQTELGMHHDAVEGEKWLRTEAARGSGSLVFSAGQLTGQAQLRQREASQRWRGIWKELRRKNLRHWLR